MIARLIRFLRQRKPKVSIRLNCHGVSVALPSFNPTTKGK